MMRFGRGILLPVVVAGSVLGLPACNKKSTTTPTPVATPTPPAVRGVLGTISFDRFESGVYVGIPLPLSQGGILDVTVDWTYKDTWMYVYIARGTCNYEQLSSKTCPYIVSSETQFPKPRIVVTQPIPAGTYTLVLYNVEKTKVNRRLGIGSDNVEAVSFQIGLTVGGAATPQTVGPITLKPAVIRR
jgi:hypothetical protein